MGIENLGYQPEELTRELKRHYISASDEDIQSMLTEIGESSLDSLFNGIPEDIRFKEAPLIPNEFSYEDLVSHMDSLAAKNNLAEVTFAAHGLPNAKVQEITPFVCGLRELVTAYTPYQPERSQGTLMTHWVYQSMMSKLTGFEAVNVSMYDRASTLYEASLTALRLHKKGDTCLLSETLYKNDIEVLETLAEETHIKFITVPVNPETGLCDQEQLKQIITENQSIAAFAFSQITNTGLIEDVGSISNLLREHKIKSIGIVDPILLGTKGLNPPATWGEKGVDIFVAEGQHLAIGPNFGGPGLGVFGVRFNAEVKTDIRSTPGRFVGKAFDETGKTCLTQVISAREQHIRREKATSNICSNQAYVSTIAGAAMLQRGESGFIQAGHEAAQLARTCAKELINLEGITLAYPKTAFFNEFTLKIDADLKALSQKGLEKNIQIGSILDTERSLLKCSFSDIHSNEDVAKLVTFFKSEFNSGETLELPEVSKSSLRSETLNLPSFDLKTLKTFYTKLSEQNISPDSSIYPLGSCTMKYNPYLNEYAASLEGFSNSHPDLPEEQAQGNLQIIFETQEIFKTMLGLDAVTTQPVAGAQGEWVGLKMMQAYHRDNSSHQRDIILIPRTAHGTNPATATMAGYTTSSGRKGTSGVVLIEAKESGMIDMDHLDSLIAEFGNRIAGVMITNPNTSGIFETNFKQIAEKIHAIDGLVYMDGANLNAIAGWLNLGAMGVDAVHSNTHKTWSIPHGGGGPGDAFVAVSNRLSPYLPGHQVKKEGEQYKLFKTEKSIGSFHRHYGNFAHKVRCYTYVSRLGREGVRKMSAVAVLSARYLKKKLEPYFDFMPADSKESCMHEFIVTLPENLFKKIEEAGVPKNAIIMRVGKLFLDFGFHAPTVAFPEVFGIMIEPTESYSKAELDRFADAVINIYKLIDEHPEVLQTVPHFTPIDRVDDVTANRNLILSESIDKLPEVFENRIHPNILADMSIEDIKSKILSAHKEKSKL